MPSSFIYSGIQSFHFPSVTNKRSIFEIHRTRNRNKSKMQHSWNYNQIKYLSKYSANFKYLMYAKESLLISNKVIKIIVKAKTSSKYLTDLNQHYKNPLKQRQQKMSSLFSLYYGLNPGPWQVREALYQEPYRTTIQVFTFLVKSVYNMKNQGRKNAQICRGKVPLLMMAE